MSRAFIHQGVWRVAPQPVVDAPAHGRATLRVSIVAALATLAIAATNLTPAPAVTSVRGVVIAQPEVITIKVDDRVPALADIATPFRRRMQQADQPIAAQETTATAHRMMPTREMQAIDPVIVRSGEQEFRLAGIVPPDEGRMCRRVDGLSVVCADRALSYLQLLVKGRAVNCERLTHHAGDRNEASCRVGDADLAEQMVRQGWARASEKPEERLMIAEAAARKQKLGIWRD